MLTYEQKPKKHIIIYKDDLEKVNDLTNLINGDKLLIPLLDE